MQLISTSERKQREQQQNSHNEELAKYIRKIDDQCETIKRQKRNNEILKDELKLMQSN